ncbi:MAG: TetR family transcriptional regulator [Pseudomonadales bacterium]
MAKQELSRQTFINVALEIIADVGVEKLSMRNVAAGLGVSAMAMYKHFSNKDELLAASLDEFIARANVVPEQSLDWPEWVQQLARGMYLALSQESSWVPLLGALQLGANAAFVTDAFVRKLSSAGFTIEQSVRAYFTMTQLVLGAVCLRASLGAEEDKTTTDSRGLAAVTHAYLANADAERLRIAPELDAILKLDKIDIGLPLLIQALQAQLNA